MKISRLFFPILLAIYVLFTSAGTVAAKDEWIQVRSKNFYLIGNTSEKDIRKVGTRLEQFRESFRLLFNKMNLTSPIQTNVIVFKDNSAYKPFKPKRADGKIDNFIAGYFQPGEDVNYITLSADGDDSQMFGTIFHEYVHFIINTNFGKSEVPPWFNEGIAEYYQTFAIAEDQKIKLGLPQSENLNLMQQNKLIPLAQLFKVSNYQLLQTGDDSRNVFYAESWALIHYLIQGGKGDALGKFLLMALKDTPPEKSFQEAFQTTYAQMEKDLRKYVSQATYKYQEITLKNKLTFDAEMQVSSLGEAESSAYLGDLLYRTDRADDAEAYLLAALKLQPEMSLANTTLGLVKMKQRKFDDAKRYLEKAIAGEQKSYMAYYRYAYLLSQEGMDESGFVQSFSKESADKMREALKKAIAINPAFTESYELLAFINLVNNEQIDESVAVMKKAIQYQPGNQRYAMRIAELYLRQENFAEAESIANKIAATADDANLKSRAENLGNEIRRMQQFKAEQEATRKQYENESANPNSGPAIRRRSEKAMSEEELTKEADTEELRSINKALRKPEPEEKRVIGYVQKIDCGKEVVFTIRTDSETFALAGKDFNSLSLNAFVPMSGDSTFGCEADVSAVRALITYKEKAAGKVRGDIVAVEFVPKDFRILSEEEMNSSRAIEPFGGPLDQKEQDAVSRAIKEALRQPQAGETRDIGYIKKIECTGKGNYFQMQTADKTYRLFNGSPNTLPIRLFTRELEGMQFGCAMKPIDVPAVFIFKATADEKSKSDGEIISIDFVPRTFKLD